MEYLSFCRKYYISYPSHFHFGHGNPDARPVMTHRHVTSERGPSRTWTLSCLPTIINFSSATCTLYAFASHDSWRHLTPGDVLTAAILRYLAPSLPNTCHQHEPSSDVFILRVRRVEARRCLNNDSEEYRIHCLLLTCTELCQVESFLSMIPILTPQFLLRCVCIPFCSQRFLGRGIIQDFPMSGSCFISSNQCSRSAHSLLLSSWIRF